MHDIGMDTEELLPKIRLSDVVYHVTRAKNIEAIYRNGLKRGSEGIFVITSPWYANEIAVNQVFADDYALFAVNLAGLDVQVDDDDVTELSAIWHRILRTDHISHERVFLIYQGRAVQNWPTVSEFEKKGRLGMSKSNVHWHFEAIRESIRSGDDRSADGLSNEIASRQDPWPGSAEPTD